MIITNNDLEDFVNRNYVGYIIDSNSVHVICRKCEKKFPSYGDFVDHVYDCMVNNEYVNKRKE